MPSKLKPPQESGEMGRIVQKIYDDLNSVIDNINTDLKGNSEPEEKSKEGSVAVVKEGGTYSLRGKTEDGWARVNMKLLGSNPESKIKPEELFSTSDNISKLTDSTTGTISNTLDDTAANQKDDIASLNAKLSTVINIVNTHNEKFNKVIEKVNDIIRRINE